MTLPGYKYLGPGNNLYSGAPVNKLDALAEKHDWQYTLAKSYDDVYKADKEFINEAKKEGFVGRVSSSVISLKSQFESKLFPLYPRLNN